MNERLQGRWKRIRKAAIQCSFSDLSGKMHAKLNFSVCYVFIEAMFLFVVTDVGTRQRARLVRSPDKCKCQLSQSALCCPASLKPSGNGAHNWPPVFIPDTLLSIFNMAAAEVTSGESALWEGEMKEQRGGEGRGREASCRFLSLSPMNAAQVIKVYPH